MNDERGDDAQMGVTSDLGGLVSRRVLGFGGRVRGGKPSTNEKPRTFGEWTMREWEWFRQAQPNGFGVGGLVPAAGSGFWWACPWRERKDEG